MTRIALALSLSLISSAALAAPPDGQGAQSDCSVG
jgi:hypothetical protein